MVREMRKGSGVKERGRGRVCGDLIRGGRKRMDVESDGALRGVQHQRFSAHHSFVISFAETAQRRMYRSHIKRGQIIPERREEKGTGEGRQKNDLFI